jgi:hypothetical protein
MAAPSHKPLSSHLRNVAPSHDIEPIFVLEGSTTLSCKAIASASINLYVSRRDKTNTTSCSARLPLASPGRQSSISWAGNDAESRDAFLGRVGREEKVGGAERV